MISQKRLQYAGFACFFFGVCIAGVVSTQLNVMYLYLFGAIGLLISAWKLTQLNDHERVDNAITRNSGAFAALARRLNEAEQEVLNSCYGCEGRFGESEPRHACPYEVAVYDNRSEEFCNCCDTCQSNCDVAKSQELD